MLLLIVIIGTLNVCLGFGLAMYYGYGPPNLDGIYLSLGPMPAASPDAALATPIGEPYIPFDTAPDGTVAPELSGSFADSAIGPRVVSLEEEDVLGDVQALAATAQAMLASDAAQAQP